MAESMPSMDCEDEEDKVICEIPVFLSKTLSKNLYLVQYPQRPATVPIKDSEVLESKVKPGLDKIQLTLGLETDSEYYDECHGERLAEAAEGLGLNEDEYIPDTRKKIDTTVLESTCHPKLTKSSRYVVGIIKQGAVHLTPLKSIVQMKPTLPFLNQADKAKVKHENATAAAVDEKEAGDGGQKVTVKFERPPYDPNKPAPFSRSSFTARKKEEEERWIPLKYESATTQVSNQLCTSNIENDEPMYVLSQKDYLAKLFPKHVEPITDGLAKSWPVDLRINVEKMKKMSLADQLKVLILNGKVMRYDQIVEFLRTRLQVKVDDTVLLRTIQNVAVLVQGVWVAKSELLYPDDYKSNANGVAGPVMQAARDTILSLFVAHKFVERCKLLPILHIPDEELTEILVNIAKRVIKIGWVFMLPYDKSFVENHPSVVQRQNMIWNKKKQHKNRKVSEKEEPSASSLKPPGSPPQRRQMDNADSGTKVENGTKKGSRGASSAVQRGPSSRSAKDPTKLGGVTPKVEREAKK